MSGKNWGNYVSNNNRDTRIRRPMNLLYTQQQWATGDREIAHNESKEMTKKFTQLGPSERFCVVCIERKRRTKRQAMCSTCITACYKLNNNKGVYRILDERKLFLRVRRQQVWDIGISAFNVEALHVEALEIGYEVAAPYSDSWLRKEECKRNKDPNYVLKKVEKRTPPPLRRAKKS